MKEVEFWRWMIPSDRKPGKLVRSRWDMTEEDAQARYPGCTRVDGTRSVRLLPDTPEELSRALHPPSMGGYAPGKEPSGGTSA